MLSIVYQFITHGDVELKSQRSVSQLTCITEREHSFSCGIFVLKIAECLINDTNCSFSTNKDSLQNERQRIRKNIVDASDPPEDFCRLCGKNNSDVVMDWICCDKYSRWFHRICLGLEKPNFQALATESWLCCICTKINYFLYTFLI
ncbi:uncharacterized protein LOC144751855 [Ciona intestinalis]